MDERQWAERLASRIHEKELAVAQRNAERIPYTAVDGVFDDRSGAQDICWWTNGFWAGQLWQLYHAFGEPRYRAVAEGIEEKLDQNLMNHMGMDHDSGFKWLLSAGANYRLTGSERAKNRALLAADNLAGRLNLKAGLIRAWNDPGTGENAGLAIIDCMMNLPLLYWASEVTRDPRYAQIAVCHADSAARAFIRPDGSVRHIVVFDPDTGAVTGEPGGQGMGPGSSWTRGQSWALYGFTLSHRHTGRAAYLSVAERVADRILARLPDSGLMPVDYDQSPDCTWEDDTAAAITACGLLELAPRTDEARAAACRAAAVKLLRVLAEQRCLWDSAVDPLLSRCSAAYHDSVHDFPIIYGDYYFTEAVLRLCGKEAFLW
ncbi:MAG: glycoside hydrolase family 88 protein [Oscillospiraceae bacterium]|nr:glycoside hydrolase family 88 protein [Oscillospiraceae bacterium]